MDSREVLRQLTEQSTERFRSESLVRSFREYLDQFQENPERSGRIAARYIADCMDHMREQNLECFEALPESEEGWMAQHTMIADATLIPQTDSWWVGANIPGKKRFLYPFVGGLDNYRKMCDKAAAEGYKGFAQTPAQ